MIAANPEQMQNWIDTVDPDLKDLVEAYVLALEQFQNISKVTRMLNQSIEAKLEEQLRNKTTTYDY